MLNGAVGFGAELLKGWSSDLVLCTDVGATLSEDESERLSKNNISIAGPGQHGGAARGQSGATLVSLHTLRHTFISRLVQAGRPLPEVAALAGHRDITMTMRYAHLAPSHLRAGIQALEHRRADERSDLALSTDGCVTLESCYFSGIA